MRHDAQPAAGGEGDAGRGRGRTDPPVAGPQGTDPHGTNPPEVNPHWAGQPGRQPGQQPGGVQASSEGRGDGAAGAGRALLMATLALATLLASLGTSIANIALPALAAAFAAPFAQVQAVVVAYLAALTLAVVIAGRLGDRHGLKPMLVAGLAVFAAASLLCALAPSLTLLVAARALQGLGAAFLMTLSMALMRQVAGAAQLGRAMGLLGTLSALGTALGPTLGGVLIPLAGWRGVFGVQVPLAALALVLAILTVPAGRDRDAGRDSRRDIPGGGTLALMRGLLANLLVNLIVAAVMMATLVVGPFYLAIALGLATPQVGLVMAVGPALSIASGMPAGRLVDSWGSRRVLSLGLALLTAGAVLMALLPNAAGVAGYVLALAVLTPGYQLFQAANNTAALAGIPAAQRGTAAGLLNLARNGGLIVGASALGAIFALAAGTETLAQATPAAIAAGMRETFLVASGLLLTALALAARGGRPAG